MKRYHVNPKTEKVGICKATSENGCRFGLTEHYPTAAEAKKAYERKIAQDNSYLDGVNQSQIADNTVTILDSVKSLPNMGNKDEELAYAQEKSQILCPNCNAAALNAQLPELTSYSYVACYACGDSYNIDDVLIEIHPEYADVEYDVGLIANRRWTHMTVRGDNWHTEACAVDNLVIHAGDPLAACDRMLGEYSQESDMQINVFELEFKDPDNLRVLETLGTDDDEEILTDLSQYDAAAYVNRWEAPGSVSIEANPNSLKVVNTSTISLAELRKIRSTYNIDETISYKVELEQMGEQIDEEIPLTLVGLSG